MIEILALIVEYRVQLNRLLDEIQYLFLAFADNQRSN